MYVYVYIVCVYVYIVCMYVKQQACKDEYGRMSLCMYLFRYLYI